MMTSQWLADPLNTSPLGRGSKPCFGTWATIISRDGCVGTAQYGENPQGIIVLHRPERRLTGLRRRISFTGTMARSRRGEEHHGVENA
jgi:hypothetical protein